MNKTPDAAPTPDEKPGRQLSATTLRIILTLAFLLMLGGGGVIVFFGLGALKTQAVETQTVVAQADTINQTNVRTDYLWDDLQLHKSDAEKANQIVAESQYYAYQDTIIQDIDIFARRAGVTVLRYDFNNEAASGGSASTAPAASNEEAAAATPADEATAASDAASTAPASALKSTTVSITVATPVDYYALLNFLHYIESNLTRMQIASVALASSGEGGGSAVTTNALTIEVYVR